MEVSVLEMGRREAQLCAPPLSDEDGTETAACRQLATALRHTYETTLLL